MSKQLIEELGVTLESVANVLKAERITGKIADPDNCPLANFFSRRCRYHVSVGSEKAFFDGFNVPLSEAAIKFRQRFDRGDYPELVS